jgi:hypothetical protein
VREDRERLVLSMVVLGIVALARASDLRRFAGLGERVAERARWLDPSRGVARRDVAQLLRWGLTWRRPDFELLVPALSPKH